MNRMICIAAGMLAGLAVSAEAVAQQESGRLRTGPPEDIVLAVTTAADGGFELSQDEFRLAWGGYYRFNLECPLQRTENEAGIGFWAPELWENAHLRIVSVSDLGGGFQDVPEINFHLQGLNLRMIECEGLGLSARFSFYPMRRGTYPFTVLDDTVSPPREMTGTFIVE